MLIDNLRLFLRIIEKGGMAAAGRDMGLSPASVSDRLASLETHYGVRLLTRTTRSISLTDEGRELVAGAKRILAETDELESRIKHGVEKLSGSLHISAPVDLGRSQLAPLLDAFIATHPEVSIDLMLSDGNIDLVGQGVDLAIRYGDLADSSLRSRKLGRNRRIVCASPDYLSVHGMPRHPEDLQHHNCLLMRFGSEVNREWRFVINGKEHVCRLHGNRIANDGGLVRQWCCEGLGIALKSEWDVHEHLQSGSLVPLLEEFEPSPSSIQLVYPAGAVQPRRVRMLMEKIVRHYETNRFP